MNYDHLTNLRQSHPAWRLLAADSAPFVIGFLHAAFIKVNVRVVPEQDLAAHLDDYLFHLREDLGENKYPKEAQEYLTDWASDERGWLRRFYVEGTDQPHYDLTPAAEQAIQWLGGLESRTFVGAESRLRLVFDLLREIAQGSETDPATRIEELERRRAALDAEIEAIRAGRIALMEPAQLRERFRQAVETARALLADFRQVEQNFRDLDRQVRERIATWEGSKGDVLDEVLGTRDVITESDQGRTFRAFWDFLMSPERQEELPALMDRILALEPIAELRPDPALRRVHHDWLAAGEQTQRTVARLSEQLRRFLDDQAWLENRRIMDLLRSVEQHALEIRQSEPTSGEFMSLDAPGPAIDLPLDRPLYRPPQRPRIEQLVVPQGDEEISVEALYDQVYVDMDRLRSRLRRTLQLRSQVTLSEILGEHPLEHGLAELVGWLTLAAEKGRGVIDEMQPEMVVWTDASGRIRRATVPKVIFVAGGGSGRGAKTGAGAGA